MTDMQRLNEMPFARHLGMEFVKVADGESVMRLATQKQHENMNGKVHGGVLPALVDAAGATCILSAVPGGRVITADLRVNFIGGVDSGDTLDVVGRVAHRAGSTGYASVTVKNGAGDLVALGQVTCIVRETR